MASLKFLLVLYVVISIAVAVDKIDPQPPIAPTETPTTSPKPSPTTTPITSTTTTSRTTTSTPTSSTTTSTPTSPTTTSKSTSPTTTSKPTSPTTTSKPTSPTTTSKPTSPTTSTPKPSPSSTTPTPKPTPSPTPTPLETGNWLVKYNSTNESCLVIDAALQIEVLLVNSTEKMNVPSKIPAQGQCGNIDDTFELVWNKTSLQINFTLNKTTNIFEVKSMQIQLTNFTTPEGLKNLTLIREKPAFVTPVGNSYKCAKEQKFNFTNGNNVSDHTPLAFLHVSNLQVQAFTNVSGHTFSNAIDCEASSVTSDVVPIVVGCVLAVLVVMIMVAYLIARRRCQARGYLSIDAQTDD